MQFHNTPLSTCEEEPFGNTHVFWWQLLITKKSHPSACRYSMLPCSRFSRGAYILLRLLAVTENRETHWLLDEIQRQPSVFVLSGPATVITDIAAASAFLADSRVVRTARTRQENNESESRTRILQPHTRRGDDFRLFCSHRTGTRGR